MTLRPVSGIAALMALTLAACGSDKAPAAAEGADAQGEILGGTISDDMLPLDELKSKSPPMKPAPGESGGPGATPSGDAAGEEEGEEVQPAEEPVESAAEPAEEG
jgi:hypothetical protein